MLKKFELSIKENCLLHNCRCKIRENNYWDNIYQMRKDKLHLYCKACPIKLPIFYTLGFQIKKGHDNDYKYILIGKEVKRIYGKLITNIIEYEIEI